MLRRFLVDSSIFFKITGLFLFALLSFLGFSFYFIKDQIEQDNQREELRYRYFISTISPIVRESQDIDVIYQYLDEFGFKATFEPRIKEQLINTNRLPPNFQGVFAKTLKTDSGIYILLQTDKKSWLFKYSPNNSFLNFYIITLVAIVLLSFMFVLLLRAFAPLKVLHSNIKKFAEGDLNISCRLDHQDEIGELAREFDNAVAKIRALNESRALFLRSIMHELNTPITKGRLITAMLEGGVAKERLNSVFTRLGDLITEFAKLEQMNSKTYKIKKREFLLSEAITETKAMLLIDNDEQIIVENEDDLLKADFELFTLALKNLFDNAIKYGEDKKVYIKAQMQNLIVSNKGKPLKAEFSEYFKPYFKENNSQGFGLGLYIIKNVLESQKFDITYEYENDFNHFIIHRCVVENSCKIKGKKDEA